MKNSNILVQNREITIIWNKKCYSDLFLFPFFQPFSFLICHHPPQKKTHPKQIHQKFPLRRKSYLIVALQKYKGFSINCDATHGAMDAIHLVRHPYNSSATFSPWMLVGVFLENLNHLGFWRSVFLNIWTNKVWNERIFWEDNSKIWRDAKKKRSIYLRAHFISLQSSTKSKKTRRFLTEVHYLLNSCCKKNWLPGGSTSKTWPKPGRWTRQKSCC